MPPIEPTSFTDAGPRHFAGLDGHFTFATISEIPKLWERFGQLGPIPAGVGQAAYGLCYEMNESGVRYLACVEVPAQTTVAQGLEIRSIPASPYAVFTHHGHVSEMPVTIDAIWHAWLPQSGRQVADNPHMLEVYGKNFDVATLSGEVEIWIPLKP